MISTANVDHSMEFTKGLILVDIIIVAGAVALAIFLYWSPQKSDSGEDRSLKSSDKAVIENPTQ